MSISFRLFNSSTSLLREIRSTRPLLQVHAQLIVSRLLLPNNVFLCNTLLSAYVNCGLIDEAQIIFSHIPNKNLFSWTIFVSGLTKNGLFTKAIRNFYEMVVIQDIRPNEITIASVLPALGKYGDPLMGKSLHCYWIKQNFPNNVYVETGLIDMYSKFGCLRVAKYLFEKMSVRRNAVTWNMIISGFSENGLWDEALAMFNRMRREGFSGDKFTIMSLVSGCLKLEDSRIGNAIHGLITVSGYESDQLVKTAIMELYINTNVVKDAYSIFCEINEKDLVAWTLMLRGYSRSGDWRRTVQHFNEMIVENGIRLDSISLTTMISACSSSGSLQHGKRVHSLAIKMGLEDDLFLGSALIDMYANCASICDAIIYFELMEEKDVACWNALISAYGIIGNGNEAINLFSKMERSGLGPNESTLVSVLCACSHSGLVDQGFQIFYHMTEIWNIVPNTTHYACLVDLLGRAGRVNDAYALVKTMHLEPGIEVYGSLLTACRIHKNYELGSEISQKLFQLKPNDAGYFITLLNIYALAGNWTGVKNTRAFLKSNNFKKDPGFSSIELNGETFMFFASQKDHSHYSEIKEFLTSLILRIRVEGYEPDMNSVYQEVSDEVKKDILFHHSEKLAIAFGLMRTKSKTSDIRVTKNLRICNDCHSACKFISRVYERTLVIKDSNRFHIFQEGICSCRDYW